MFERVRGPSKIMLLATFGGLGIASYLLAPNRIELKDNFARIHVGMNRAEAEKLIGAPPGDYSGIFRDIDYPDGISPDAFRREGMQFGRNCQYAWLTDRCALMILCSENVVIRKQLTEIDHKSISFFHLFRQKNKSVWR